MDNKHYYLTVTQEFTYELTMHYIGIFHFFISHRKKRYSKIMTNEYRICNQVFLRLIFHDITPFTTKVKKIVNSVNRYEMITFFFHLPFVSEHSQRLPIFPKTTMTVKTRAAIDTKHISTISSKKIRFVLNTFDSVKSTSLPFILD